MAPSRLWALLDLADSVSFSRLDLSKGIQSAYGISPIVPKKELVTNPAESGYASFYQGAASALAAGKD